MLEWSSTYLSNFAGVIAFVLSLVIWATSLDRVRRKMFEVFYYAHQLYLPYLFFYMLHVGVAYLCMILPGIFLFLIDRHLRFLQSRRRARLDSTRLLPNGTMELTFSKDPGEVSITVNHSLEKLNADKTSSTPFRAFLYSHKRLVHACSEHLQTAVASFYSDVKQQLGDE